MSTGTADIYIYTGIASLGVAAHDIIERKSSEPDGPLGYQTSGSILLCARHLQIIIMGYPGPWTHTGSTTLAILLYLYLYFFRMISYDM